MVVSLDPIPRVNGGGLSDDVHRTKAHVRVPVEPHTLYYWMGSKSAGGLPKETGTFLNGLWFTDDRAGFEKVLVCIVRDVVEGIATT